MPSELLGQSGIAPPLPEHPTCELLAFISLKGFDEAHPSITVFDHWSERQET